MHIRQIFYILQAVFASANSLQELFKRLEALCLF